MRNLLQQVSAFVRDGSGASSSEYALILGVIGVGVGAATLVLGANVGAAVNGKAKSFDPEFASYAGGSPPGGGNGGSGGNAGNPSGGSGASSGGSTDGGSGGSTGPGNGNGNGNGANPKGGGSKK